MDWTVHGAQGLTSRLFSHIFNQPRSSSLQTYVELLGGEIEVEFTGPGGDTPGNLPTHELSAEDVNAEDANSGSGQASQTTSPVMENLTISQPGKRIQVPSGQYHKIHTKGDYQGFSIKATRLLFKYPMDRYGRWYSYCPLFEAPFEKLIKDKITLIAEFIFLVNYA